MNLLVRRAAATDAAGFARVAADPAVYPQVLQMPYPSLEQWQARLAEANAPGSTHLVLAAECDGEVVGHAGLHPAGASPRRRHAAILGITVAGAWQGRGVGHALMQALVDYADRWAQITRIELTVYTDNDRAIALYRRFGFEVEGTLKAYAMRDGRHADVLTMARLAPALAARG